MNTQTTLKSLERRLYFGLGNPARIKGAIRYLKRRVEQYCDHEHDLYGVCRFCGHENEYYDRND